MTKQKCGMTTKRTSNDNDKGGRSSTALLKSVSKKGGRDLIAWGVLVDAAAGLGRLPHWEEMHREDAVVFISLFFISLLVWRRSPGR